MATTNEKKAASTDVRKVRQRSSFSQQFKQEAVQMLLDGHSAVSVAERLGRTYCIGGSASASLKKSYGTPNGKVDLEFVRKLDPALTRVDDLSDSAVLVVHPLIRAVPLFVEKSERTMPGADPVETALDLFDLSLTTQANQLLTHLRSEFRLA